MDERSRRVQRIFEIPVIVAALLTIPAIAIEQSSLGEPWDGIAALLNWTTWIVFLAELVIMLALVPDRRRYLRENPLDLPLVLLTPPILPPGLQSLRALRLLRILRLLRVARLARRVFSFDGLRYAAFLALLTLVGGVAAFQVAECVYAGSGLAKEACCNARPDPEFPDPRRGQSGPPSSGAPSRCPSGAARAARRGVEGRSGCG